MEKRRVLVISHNVFSETSNMGKTLCSYFAAWEPEDLAQFYIHREVPTSRICQNYYRITDTDAIRSIFSRKSGTLFREADIQEGRRTARTDRGWLGGLYQAARRRTPLIYCLRDAIWALGAWNTRQLRRWLEDFQPEAVFFAAGDYGFLYRIASQIAKTRGIPLFSCCVDDFYLYNRNQNKPGGKLVQACFLRQVRRTMEDSACIFTICDAMARAYEPLFRKPCYTLHTASALREPVKTEENASRISYIGNVSGLRHLQLIDIGRTLKRLEGPGIPKAVDVYSAEKRPEIVKDLTEENGIRFHGPVDGRQLGQVMAGSLLLIHTESFEKAQRRRVLYSVSTKIADSLASGICLLAYGPAEVASIRYLQEHQAAFCITDAASLEEDLRRILTDEDLRRRIARTGRRLAEENHLGGSSGRTILEVINRGG